MASNFKCWGLIDYAEPSSWSVLYFINADNKATMLLGLTILLSRRLMVSELGARHKKYNFKGEVVDTIDPSTSIVLYFMELENINSNVEPTGIWTQNVKTQKKDTANQFNALTILIPLLLLWQSGLFHKTI